MYSNIYIKLNIYTINIYIINNGRIYQIPGEPCHRLYFQR